MLVFRSLTSSMLDYVRGEFPLEFYAHPKAQFEFGCSRKHVLTEGLYPCEATWANPRGMPLVHEDMGSTEIRACFIHADILPKIETFIAIIRKADEENRVRWGKDDSGRSKGYGL